MVFAREDSCKRGNTMIFPINEGSLRAAVKIESIGSAYHKQTAQYQAAEARQIRPVEDSEAGSKADNKSSQKEDQTQYVMKDDTLVFEKYNQQGDLIFRLPDCKPVDEHA